MSSPSFPLVSSFDKNECFWFLGLKFLYLNHFSRKEENGEEKKREKRGEVKGAEKKECAKK